MTEKNSEDFDLTTLIKKFKKTKDINIILDLLNGNLEFEDVTKIILLLNKYYEEGKSIISDSEYDYIFELFEQRINQEKKDLNEVLNELNIKLFSDKVKNRIKLPYYLPSIKKNKNQKTLDDWLNDEGKVFIMPKLDGLSVLFDFENQIMYTKGDGENGFVLDKKFLQTIDNEDYSTHLKGLVDKKHILKDSDIDLDSEIKFVRGELIMSKENFDKVKNKDEFSSIRSYVTSIVNSKKVSSKYLKGLDFIAYEIIEPKYRFRDQITLLRNNNFKTIDVICGKFENKSLDSLNEIIDSFIQFYNYPVDGLVLRKNKIVDNDTSKKYYPQNLLALKKPSETFKNKIKNIHWKLSSKFIYSPTIELEEPIEYNNKKYKKITGHNYEYLVNNKLYIGNEIYIKILGEIPIFDLETKREIDENNLDLNLPEDAIIKDNKVYGEDKLAVLNKNILHLLKTLKIKGYGEAKIKKILETLDTDNVDTIYDFLNTKNAITDKLKTLPITLEEFLIGLNSSNKALIKKLFDANSKFKIGDEIPKKLHKYSDVLLKIIEQFKTIEYDFVS